MEQEQDSILYRLTPFHAPIFGEQRDKFAEYMGLEPYYNHDAVDRLIGEFERGMAALIHAGVHPDAIIDAIKRFERERLLFNKVVDCERAHKDLQSK